MGSLLSSATVPDSQRRNVANKPVEVALNEIVTRARVFTDAGGAAIALRDGEDVVTRASSGTLAPPVETRISIKESLTGQALLKGVPIHVEDSDKDPRVDAATCRAMDTRCFIVTPIAGSTTMLGVLAVFASTPNAFTRTDLAVLRTMADQISNALGGGAFMQQQAWSTLSVEEPELGDAPADWQPPYTPIEQLALDSIKTVFAGPASAEPASAESAKPAIAEMQFTPDEVDPLQIESAAPIVASAKIETLPSEKRAEPELQTEHVVPIAKPAEPVAVPTAEPERPAHVAPVTNTRPASQPSGRTKKSEPVNVQPNGQPKEITSARGAEEPGVVSLIDAVEQHIKPQHAITRAARAKIAATKAAAVEAPQEKVEWKGLSVDAAADRRPIARIVAGVAAVVVIIVAIVAGMSLHKPSRTEAAGTATPIPATNNPVVAPDKASAPASAPARLADSSPASAAAPKSEFKQQTNAKPAQPAIVLAPSAPSNRDVAAEEQAPPQLAFSGDRPKLMDTAALPTAAAPKRAITAPVTAELIRKVAPAYPEMARRLHQRGSVVLQAEVRKDGTVGKVDVVSGATLLSSAAVDAVKKWRYKPAQLGGAPVDSFVRIVVNFDTQSE
jgi:TonB family protein